MSEWWSYRPSDFLLYSARTYLRLIERYNAEVWPLHAAALVLALALPFAAMRGAAGARIALATLAVCWCWVAWAFHLQRFAAIQWAAPWFAAAFAAEGALLLLYGAFGAVAGGGARRGGGRIAGLGLLLFALFVLPWLGLLWPGRSWRAVEVFGLAPDPTALATVGLLLLLRLPSRWAWVLWPVPLAWCLVGAAALWAMLDQGGFAVGSSRNEVASRHHISPTLPSQSL